MSAMRAVVSDSCRVQYVQPVKHHTTRRSLSSLIATIMVYHAEVAGCATETLSCWHACGSQWCTKRLTNYSGRKQDCVSFPRLHLLLLLCSCALVVGTVERSEMPRFLVSDGRQQFNSHAHTHTTLRLTRLRTSLEAGNLVFRETVPWAHSDLSSSPSQHLCTSFWPIS